MEYCHALWADDEFRHLRRWNNRASGVSKCGNTNSRRYDDFQKLFQRLSRGTDDTKKRLENIEKAIVLWKKYLERLENKPFTTFTTKEILDNLKDNRLADALREIDATVYGGVYSKKTIASLQVLQELAEGIYRERRAEMGVGA